MNWRSWPRAASVPGVALAAVVVPVGGSPALVTTPGWQLAGPNDSGGHLAFSAAMPSRLYVLPDTGRDVYRTDDHGRTWQLEGGLGVPAAVGNRIAAMPTTRASSTSRPWRRTRAAARCSAATTAPRRSGRC